MESIMKLMGIDSKEFMGVFDELQRQFKQLCVISEHNREMLVFLCEKLTPEESDKLQKRLDEVTKKYETTDN